MPSSVDMHIIDCLPEFRIYHSFAVENIMENTSTISWKLFMREREECAEETSKATFNIFIKRINFGHIFSIFSFKQLFNKYIIFKLNIHVLKSASDLTADKSISNNLLLIYEF